MAATGTFNPTLNRSMDRGRRATPQQTKVLLLFQKKAACNAGIGRKAQKKET